MSGIRIPDGHPGFGKYRPIAILGRGGMATVYLATASGPGGFTKLFVIKELKPELAEEAEFRAMFLEEARLAARLSHPNIVQTFEVVDEAHVQFIVMEYLEGQSLRGLRGTPEALGDAPVASQARIVADMLAGLHAAHELTGFDGEPLKVVHRDVSPHNVIVTYDGEVKLVDFGIAKAIDSSARTSTGAIKGKLSYMPPEQAFGTGVDRRADVFAAGIVLWEAATGTRMWEGLTEPGVMHRLSQGAIPRVRDVVRDAPVELDRIVARALEVRPENRYPTAAAFQADIERYLATLPQAPSARQVGAMAGRAFADQRAEIKQIVDEQLRRESNRGSTVGSLPRLPGMVPATGSSSLVPQEGTRSSAVVTHDVRRGAVTERSALIMALAAAGIAVSSVVVASAVLLTRRPIAATASSTSTPTALPTPRSTPTSPPSSTSPSTTTPSTLRLTILAKPRSAKVYLDGKLLDGDPHVADVDDALHRVHIEAPGFAPYDESLKLDADRRLDVSLHRPPVGAKPGKASAEEDIGF